MSKKLFSLLMVAAFTAVLYTGCAKPPTELQSQAQQALDAAKAEGADAYAKDGYDKAASLLSEGNGLVDSKDYKGAAEKYQAALDAANAAKAAVGAAKEALKKEVAAQVDAILASLESGKKVLDGAKTLSKADKEKFATSWKDAEANATALKAAVAADPLKAKGEATTLANAVKTWGDELTVAMTPPAKGAKGAKGAPAKTEAEKKSPAGDKKPAGKK